MEKKFLIVLQAGKETHEGMARALHSFLYANELMDKGYKVSFIFDGAATEWYEELNRDGAESKILPMYQEMKKKSVPEAVCDYCAGAFGIKEKVSQSCPLTGEYKSHPSLEKWISQGYQIIIL